MFSAKLIIAYISYISTFSAIFGLPAHAPVVLLVTHCTYQIWIFDVSTISELQVFFTQKYFSFFIIMSYAGTPLPASGRAAYQVTVSWPRRAPCVLRAPPRNVSPDPFPCTDRCVFRCGWPLWLGKCTVDIHHHLRCFIDIMVTG